MDFVGRSACQALAPSGESLERPAGTLFAGAKAAAAGGDATGASRIPRRMLMPKEQLELGGGILDGLIMTYLSIYLE